MTKRYRPIRMPFGKGPVATFIKRLVAGVVVVFLAIWGWLQLDSRSLRGISVAGDKMPRTADPRSWLKNKAGTWEMQSIAVRAGNMQANLPRADFGARRPYKDLADRIHELGRSGNPFADVASWWTIMRNGRDFPWPPAIDRNRLFAVVNSAREQIERPPVAGTIDEEGWSAPGIAGRTLNSVDSVGLLEDALRRDLAFVELPMVEVPPPDPIQIGPPDAQMFADEPNVFVFDERDRRVIRAQPPPGIVWAPDRGRECYPPDEGRIYCQGPRRVPLSRGPAARVARSLGLGDINYIGRLFYAEPDPAWVQHAGPAGAETLLWPVPGGVFVRGYGYVRRGALRHKIHKGIDIGAPIGTPIKAMKDGIIAFADNTIRGYGNLLTIVHGDGSVSNYAHCNAIYVFPGQKVHRGQVVGEVGNTGYSGGPHLHFEYRVGGKAVNPRRLLVM